MFRKKRLALHLGLNFHLLLLVLLLGATTSPTTRRHKLNSQAD
jgi:hypothetical protein